MFLVDKYNDITNRYIYKNTTINSILDSFNAHNKIYKNIDEIMLKPEEEFNKVVGDLETGVFKYANFQHLIIYGALTTNKEYLVNLILERIYGKNNIELKDVEYIINGYGNTKTKVTIKQSKYHIIIEPNSNGFDKYLIQEIIQDYAKTELLNIMKYKKLFKIVVINKLDNLSYYAQASLRRTMEKYSDTCKFIFICDQLSKIIEPIRSRCILFRTILPKNEQIFESLLKISDEEKLTLNFDDYNNIIKKSDNKINQSIWLLELLNVYNLDYDKNWSNLIDDIVQLIINKKNYCNKKFFITIKKIREIFYNLFITNIPTQTIIRLIMKKLIENIDDLQLKVNVIEITSIFELRLAQGTRQIVQFEAYIIRIFYLFNLYSKGETYKYNLDLLEI
jgi:replication factor C subunit 3/5